MARKLTPKCKQCRRAGEKLFLKGEKCFTAKCPIVKRNYAPGIHGPNQRTRLSEYGMQLKEKQKTKAMYRLMERQFFGYYEKAINSSQETGLEMLSLLERRLDNVVYRLGLVMSRDQARQLVTHGHIKVNGRKVNIPSYQVKAGDKIDFKEKSKKLAIVKASIDKKKSDIPDWLNLEDKDKTAQVINLPKQKDLNVGVQTRLIIEYYSR
jgi:small subunit ribosomal protein S4